MTAPAIVVTGGAHEYFPTPKWVTVRFLERMRAKQRLGPFLGRVLEPCAGDGAIIRAATEYVDGLSMGRELRWHANEIRPEAALSLAGTLDRLEDAGELRLGSAITISDFLREPPPGHFHAALTNPPFTKAMEFIVRARACCDVVAMLLRINIMSSEDRAPYFMEPDNRPDLYILPNRPAFFCGENGQLQTDATDYAWMVWGQRAPGVPSTWEVLDSTPLEERKRDSAGAVRFVDAQLGLFAEGA